MILNGLFCFISWALWHVFVARRDNETIAFLWVQFDMLDLLMESCIVWSYVMKHFQSLMNGSIQFEYLLLSPPPPPQLDLSHEVLLRLIFPYVSNFSFIPPAELRSCFLFMFKQCLYKSALIDALFFENWNEFLSDPNGWHR